MVGLGSTNHQHGCGNGQHDHRGADIGLQHDQTNGDTRDHDDGDQRTQRQRAITIPAQKRCNRNDQTNLGELRGLGPETPKLEPRRCAVYLDACEQHKRQQCNRGEKREWRQSEKPAIVEEDNSDDQDQTNDKKYGLSFDKGSDVVLVVAPSGCAVDTEESDDSEPYRGQHW